MGELLFRAENLPPPRPFAKKTAVETNEPVQRYTAPHFSAAPAGGDNAVIFAAGHGSEGRQNPVRIDRHGKGRRQLIRIA